MTTHAAYRHSQTYTVLWLILVVTGIFGTLMISIEGDADALAGLAIMAASLLGALLCLGRLVIEVHAEEVRWSFGYVGWPHWSEPMTAIVDIEITRAAPLGSGIKGSAQHRQFNVTMGGPAVRLHLNGGRSVTLGTPEPQRLASFIEARLPSARR